MSVVRFVPVTADVTADIHGHANVRLKRRGHVGFLGINVFYGTHVSSLKVYRGTSLTRRSLPLGPYSNPMPRALWWY